MMVLWVGLIPKEAGAWFQVCNKRDLRTVISMIKQECKVFRIKKSLKIEKVHVMKHQRHEKNHLNNAYLARKKNS